MAGSINKVILIGNLGREPEVRHTQSGGKVANLNLATNETWKDRETGERREKTEWHRVVIFDDMLCDIAERYLRKGSKVYIEGQLQTRKWTGQDGVEKYTTEVVLNRFRGTMQMLDGRGDGGEGGGGGGGGYADAGSSPASDFPDSGPPSGAPADLDDEIPF